MPPKKSKYDQTDPLTPILVLLDEDAELAKGHQEYTAKASQLDAEKKKFIREGNIEDDETFRLMSTVVLKLELSQNRVEQIKARRAAICDEIAAANVAACNAIAPEIWRRINDEIEKLKNQLRPLFVTTYEAKQAIDALVPYAAVLKPLYDISRSIEFQKNIIAGASDMFESSRRFIGVYRAFLANDVAPDAPAARFTP